MTEESIRVELSELRGEVLTELKHLSHDIRGLKQAMESLVTRREVTDIHDRRKEAHMELERRVEKLEATRDRLVWAIVLQWLAAIGAVGWKVSGKL